MHATERGGELTLQLWVHVYLKIETARVLPGPGDR